MKAAVIRILLFGDNPGVPCLLKHIPRQHVAGIVAAANRPQYHQPLLELATEINVPFCIQPLPNDPGYSAFRQWVIEQSPDLIWVNSYSMIVRADILSVPHLGGINIHGALLPQYRGCNPTQWAILNNEIETGVTLHEMSVGIDEGHIIAQKTVPLYFEDTWATAHRRIAHATHKLIAENMPSILAQSWQGKAQEEDKAHYHRRRKPEDGLFRWDQPVVEIHNLIRALVAPLPGAFYVNDNGDTVSIREYLSPTKITQLKYSSVGGKAMASNRICLRPLRNEDRDLLYQWISDRELFILKAPYHPILETDHDQWTESMIHKRSDLVPFVIEDQTTQEAIGTCQLLNINWRHRSAELQIRIGSTRHRNRGLGADAVKLLVNFGFKDLNLHRIYLHVSATNQRAIRAYMKCGFQQDGLLRDAALIDGKWVDVFVMALLES